MNASVKPWVSQITTGIGALIATPTVIALLSHQITWQQAVPPILAAIIGLVWPEHWGGATAAAPIEQTASAVAQDVLKLVPMIVSAYEHGKTTAPIPAPAPTPQPVVSTSTTPAQG